MIFKLLIFWNGLVQLVMILLMLLMQAHCSSNFGMIQTVSTASEMNHALKLKLHIMEFLLNLAHALT